MLPLPLQYQEVIQNPQHCFQDSDLKQRHVETDQRSGLPRARSGGFAITYKLIGNGNDLAVRCFHKPASDREARQLAISGFLRSHPSKYFIPTRYLKNGILVKGNWFPLTYMPWVKGDTLDNFLDRNFRNIQLIASLIEEFTGLVQEISQLNIAHGDLSSANLMVSNNKLILVDYDGMYVPELNGFISNELGNIHFQHPGRTERHFNAHLDRFSAIVIWLALEALHHNPDLWNKYGTGEGLLFSRKDFSDPRNSPLLRDIEKCEDLHPFVNLFRDICLSDVTSVPQLSDFIANRPFVYSQPSIPAQVDYQYVSQYPIYLSANKSALLRNLGERVEVVGRIIDIHYGKVSSPGKNYGSPYAFLNFGDWHTGSFQIVIWSEVLDLFNRMNRTPDDLYQRWVSVTGILSVYNGAPQIVLETPKYMEELSGEKEARERLAGVQIKNISANTSGSQLAKTPVNIPPPISQTTPTGRRDWVYSDGSDKLNKLYQMRQNPSGQSYLPSKSPIQKNQSATPSFTHSINSKSTMNITQSVKQVNPSIYLGGTDPLGENQGPDISNSLNKLYASSKTDLSPEKNKQQAVKTIEQKMTSHDWGVVITLFVCLLVLIWVIYTSSQ